MKKLILLMLEISITCSFCLPDDYFAGKITYKNSFTDLEGNDITEQLAPYLGKESHYYIDGNNYKAYDEAKNWIQLYNGSTNTYYSFTKQKTATKIDGSKKTSSKFEVEKLPGSVKIAGYDCEIIQFETDDATTIMYYNKQISIDTANFTAHNFGNWNQLMQATDGALNLKFVMKNHKQKFVWTSTATSVKRMKLKETDFEFPKDVEIK